LYAEAGPLLERWAAFQGTAFLDLTGVFEHSSETIYSDSVHFTGKRGYAALFDEVERQGLIDRIAARYRQWQARHTTIDTTIDTTSQAARKISWAQ